MMINPAVLISLFFSSVCLAQPGVKQKVESIPIETFSRHPWGKKAKISPKGTYLATSLVAQNKHVLAFVKITPKGLEDSYIFQLGQRGFAYDFYWVNDERLIIEMAKYRGGFVQPRKYGELFAINADGKRPKRLFGYRVSDQQTGTHIRKAKAMRAWGEVLDPLPNDERFALIKARPWSSNRESYPSVYKIDVYSGVTTKLTTAPLTNMDFITDEKGQVRIAVGYDDDAKLSVYYKEKLGEDWRELVDFKGFTQTSSPIRFRTDNRTMYVSDENANENGVMGLYQVNIDTGERKQLFQNDKFSIGRIVYDHQAKEIVAVEYHPGLPAYAYIEKKNRLARLLKGLHKSFPGSHIRFPSATSDGKLVLMFVYSDRNPGEYYLLDTTKPSVDYLLSKRAGVKSDLMATTKHFAFNSSDGLEIHAYLTMPNDQSNNRTPLVVMPHGGPHYVRSTWGFSADAQLLASRGYAVLEVNYRGSSGYGTKFAQAGEKHWGDLIQQDIIEGTRFALKSEALDSSRVCIYGGSFGGYSALQSSILAPDLFKCAIAYSGIFDLAMLYDEGDIPDTKNGIAYLGRTIGNQKEELKRQSPVHNAAKIQAPVLLIHGGKDERAPIDHAEAMKEALEAANKDVEWFVKDDEEHGFDNEANRKEAYERILAFLDKHIGSGI